VNGASASGALGCDLRIFGEAASSDVDESESEWHRSTRWDFGPGDDSKELRLPRGIETASAVERRASGPVERDLRVHGERIVVRAARILGCAWGGQDVSSKGASAPEDRAGVRLGEASVSAGARRGFGPRESSKELRLWRVHERASVLEGARRGSALERRARLDTSALR
jgi:hypothetical protein